MALAIRFVALRATLTANGRSYGATVGSTVDIGYSDALAIGPDQGTKLMIVCATADRPTNQPGQINWPPREMYDTTLGKPIFLVPGSSPASWVDISGSAV
jgi:hypothetical protein